MINFEELPNDFEVRYRFYSEAEGGRNAQQFFQGYRCDWVYADFEGAEPRQVWMIWPIFVDESGQFVPENAPVDVEGTARMMIVNEELRQTIHKGRIRPGVKGFFVEGQKKVAEATVIRVPNLAKEN